MTSRPTMRGSSSGLDKLVLKPQWAGWLLQGGEPAGDALHTELIGSLAGHRSNAAFGVVSVAFVSGCYAITYAIEMGCILLALTLLIGIWRIAAVNTKGRASSTTQLIWSGLAWACVVGLSMGESARTGQLMLTTLGGLVATGLAFGVAFSNAGAPRFAKLQALLIMVPFTVCAGVSSSPEMLLIPAQMPFWIWGTFGVIGDLHATKANLIKAQHASAHLAYHDALTGLPTGLSS